MGKTWKTVFRVQSQLCIKEEKYATTFETNVIAKDGNDALKKISKELNNSTFDRLVIDAGPRVLK